MVVSNAKQRHVATPQRGVQPYGRQYAPDQVVSTVDPETDRVLVDQVSIVLDRHGGDWLMETTGATWCMVSPVGQSIAEQGWKLHVSATPLSATLVLARSAEVLVRNGCAFKFAATLDVVGELVSPECPRGSGGKFLTAYPRDDAHFRAVAEELHCATEHLPGPAVLSDRAYRPGSLVHYRYGAFSGVSVLGNDGSYRNMLRAPGGELVADDRDAWYQPPTWARSPLATDEAPAHTGSQTPQAVVLDGRFEVREAFRHSLKGGVYRAIDLFDGAEVVVKEARPHVVALLDGTDGRDALRNEAQMLDLLAPTGYVPRRLALLTQQDHLFLVEEEITGTTLLNWLHDRVQDGLDGRSGAVFALPVGDVVDVAQRLVSLLSAVHERGVVLRDFSPSNVLLTDDGQVRLVDLEHASRPGAWVVPAGTPGFMPVHQMATATRVPAPDQSVDRYALGCLIYQLATGGTPPDRPDPQRFARLVAAAGVHNGTLRRLAPLILGLCAHAPAECWGLDRAATFLSTVDRTRTGPRTAATTAGGAATTAGGAAVAPSGAAIAATEACLGHAAQERLLGDSMARLVATMRPADPEWLWAPAADAEDDDPCNVQQGAAGTLAVLTRACDRDAGSGLRDAVKAAAGWLHRRLPAEPRTLPGLYFGRAGAAWAMFDAARLLGDERIAGCAVDLAHRLPTRWPNPDVCHGTAGAGLACLYLAAATGDERLTGKVIECADHLVAVARHRKDGVFWPVAADFDSALAGLTHYGFAHGVAGVGTFLLAAGQALGNQRYLEMAQLAGATLRRAVHRPGEAAWWPIGEESDPRQPFKMAHWCSGSSGIGTFLLRLWQFTNDPADRELAEAAAVAVRRVTWQVTTSACHGLAGDGQFLLDLAQALDDQRYRHWAEELAACLHAGAVELDGRLAVPADDGTSFHAGYGTGLAGVVDFLLRLRHGGPRPWMPEPMPSMWSGRAVAPAAGESR
jgi:hypothetical protein